MTMNAGSVSINLANGNASGAGLAKEIFDDYIAKVASTIPEGAGGAVAKKNIADLCNSFASVTLAHIAAHAEVTVTVAATDAGLQRAPNPNTASADTQGPAGPKTLSTKATVA